LPRGVGCCQIGENQAEPNSEKRRDMGKNKKLPREGLRNADDGLDATAPDTEGHVRLDPDGLKLRGPGTGGDISARRPSSGGELVDDNDVEGHVRLDPDGVKLHGPGTGGDFTARRPSSGGEFVDDNDVEGHRL
jgi:hypothetical protein